MGFFGKKPELTTARSSGELLALRLTLATLLEAVSGDFEIGDDLSRLRIAGLAEAALQRLPTPAVQGFDEFMGSFIAAARRHS